MDHADEATKEAVKQGDLSINQAYQETQEKRKHSPANTGRGPKDRFHEVEEVEQASDKDEASPAIRPVFLSPDHFEALRELGGSIEEQRSQSPSTFI